MFMFDSSSFTRSQEVVEDWMSVSFWLPHSPEAQMPMRIPEQVEQLGHDTDGIRWQSVEAKVSEQRLGAAGRFFSHRGNGRATRSACVASSRLAASRPSRSYRFKMRRAAPRLASSC